MKLNTYIKPGTEYDLASGILKAENTNTRIGISISTSIGTTIITVTHL